jgi:hypothetical protein
MKLLSCVRLLFAIAALGFLAPLVRPQATVDLRTPSSIVSESSSSTTTPPPPAFLYTRPTAKAKLHNYLFDAFGPFPIAGAALIAALNQSEKTPPEWGSGGSAYAQRFGSNLGIAAVTTTTRYGLAKIFREDTVYYRCECAGLFPRLGHALLSTVTSRRGEDGHRQFSFPAIVAPYAGTMTAVYLWYPNRYGPKDALRMGNYNLLAFAGENLALEFIYGGPHTIFSHFHRPAFSGTDAASAPNP